MMNVVLMALFLYITEFSVRLNQRFCSLDGILKLSYTQKLSRFVAVKWRDLRGGRVSSWTTLRMVSPGFLPHPVPR